MRYNVMVLPSSCPCDDSDGDDAGRCDTCCALRREDSKPERAIIPASLTPFHGVVFAPFIIPLCLTFTLRWVWQLSCETRLVAQHSHFASWFHARPSSKRDGHKPESLDSARLLNKRALPSGLNETAARAECSKCWSVSLKDLSLCERDEATDCGHNLCPPAYEGGRKAACRDLHPERTREIPWVATFLKTTIP